MGKFSKSKSDVLLSEAPSVGSGPSFLVGSTTDVGFDLRIIFQFDLGSLAPEIRVVVLCTTCVESAFLLDRRNLLVPT